MYFNFFSFRWSFGVLFQSLVFSSPFCSLVFLSLVFLLSLKYLFSFFFLLLLSGDVETNPGPRAPARNARVMYANILGLHKNIKELAIASKKFDVVCCSETLTSNRRNQVELLIPGFNKPILTHKGATPNARGMAVYIRSGYSAYRKSTFECTCHEMICVRVCGKFNNFYIFSCYRNPNPDDTIYDCLVEKMAVVQENDVKATFVIVGDFNAHHQQWSTNGNTDARGRAAFDFATLSGTDQVISGPTHREGNCLDLLFTDVPGLVSASIGTPVGRSDHCLISCDIKVVQNISNITISKKVYIKSRANWDTISGDIANISWPQIFNDNDPASRLNSILVDIIDRRIPSRILRHRQKDKPWFNDTCQRAYDDKQEAYRLWTRNRSLPHWNNYINLRNEANLVYTAAEAEYNSHAQVVLEDCEQPHKWWQTLKASLFGVSSSIPPLLTSDGSVTNSPQERSQLLSDVFRSKQSDQSLDLPPACFPEVSLSSFAFRSKEVMKLLGDLDSYGGVDPNGIFPLFLKMNKVLLAPKLSIFFRRLIRSGDFPEVWRTANVTPIPKTSPPSVHPENYRPISITPCISKVYERLICDKLMKFVEHKHLLPDGQFAYRKNLGSCDALLSLVCSFQSALDKGSESCAISLDFSAAFDRINHVALIYRLQLLGIGGLILNIIKNFLTARTQQVVIDGFRGSIVPVVSGVPQGSVLGPTLFILFTSDMWSQVTNPLIAYADDATLFATIDSPHERESVGASLNRDLARIVDWCRIWGMKLNPSKTQAIYFTRSRTVIPEYQPLILDGQTLTVSDSMKILGVTLDSKLSFEDHITLIASTITKQIGLIRKSLKVFNNQSIAIKCFYSFILPIFEYCSPVWSSSANCHLMLLDRALSQIKTLIPRLNIDLKHRRDVASLCMFYKIFNNRDHPVHSLLPSAYNSIRFTRFSDALNSKAFYPPLCNTFQFKRCFIPANVPTWNVLPDDVVDSPVIQKFKVGVNGILLNMNRTTRL